MMRLSLLVLPPLALLLAATSGVSLSAESRSVTLSVSVTVIRACSITTNANADSNLLCSQGAGRTARVGLDHLGATSLLHPVPTRETWPGRPITTSPADGAARTGDSAAAPVLVVNF